MDEFSEDFTWVLHSSFTLIDIDLDGQIYYPDKDESQPEDCGSWHKYNGFLPRREDTSFLGLQNPQEVDLYAKYLKECTDERPTTFQVEYAWVVLDVAGLKLEDQADSDAEVNYQKD